MSNIYAVIYPVPITFAGGLFDRSRLVFLKYTTHEAISDDLKDCKKLLFYESRAEKKIIGEGKIEKIELLNLKKILEKYEDDLFLTKKELCLYADGREKRPLVFTLKNPQRFNNKIKLKNPITMSGKQLTKKEYEKLFD